MRKKVRAIKEEWNAAREKCDVWERLEEHVKEQLGRCVVRHMLFSERDKPGQLVARAKLAGAVKNELGTNKHYSKLTHVWLPWARYLAATRHGLEIAEVRSGAPVGAGAGSEAPDGAAGAGGGGSAGHFVLRSLLPVALQTEFVERPGVAEGFRGFALVVLALIQAMGGKADEDVLWRYLGQLGLDAEDLAAGGRGAAAAGGRSAAGQPPEHPALGRLADQVRTLEARRYISVVDTKQNPADGRTVRVLGWGDAALSEVTVQGVAELVDKMHQRVADLNRAAGGDEEGEEQAQ